MFSHDYFFAPWWIIIFELEVWGTAVQMTCRSPLGPQSKPQTRAGPLPFRALPHVASPSSHWAAMSVESLSGNIWNCCTIPTKWSLPIQFPPSDLCQYNSHPVISANTIPTQWSLPIQFPPSDLCQYNSHPVISANTAIQRAEGPSRWLKATSPPQELEVGAHRAPYLLVDLIFGLIQSFLMSIPTNYILSLLKSIICQYWNHLELLNVTTKYFGCMEWKTNSLIIRLLELQGPTAPLF